MYSYPNFVPVTPECMERVVATVTEVPFARIYGMYWEHVMEDGVREALRRSVERFRRGGGEAEAVAREA
jgi:hypothetical protein